jgi:hypothetical protein
VEGGPSVIIKVDLEFRVEALAHEGSVEALLYFFVGGQALETRYRVDQAANWPTVSPFGSKAELLTEVGAHEAPGQSNARFYKLDSKLPVIFVENDASLDDCRTVKEAGTIESGYITSRIETHATSLLAKSPVMIVANRPPPKHKVEKGSKRKRGPYIDGWRSNLRYRQLSGREPAELPTKANAYIAIFGPTL